MVEASIPNDSLVLKQREQFVVRNLLRKMVELAVSATSPRKPLEMEQAAKQLVTA